MADSMENNSVNLADNTPDNSLQLGDNPADDRQNIDNFSKISILELQKKYGIGRDPLYNRMKYLRITTWKIGKKAYLDAEQIAHMDGLHDHIKTTGKMEGYPVPEPSGPIEVEDEQPTPTTTLTVATQTQQIAAPNYAPTQKRSQSSDQVNDVAAIITSAQNKAAGTLIAENMLAQHFIQNPDLLPDELKAKIKESGEMPSVDPFAYADSLINSAMGSISVA
ncbi:hypothetical protein Nos7524_5677 (plasmid) [Nostoc sp. PCC 7524]|uniref:hypothetical protein n=1 Tax=Nostoc sp. (strain ATCC 29411 / PCC 7524) TaxID=28072 RepID=UPI00029F48A5|nr:hypothetical protein [Nostoc sp. PCC 7524]AFY51366.1 hypothetical protein Nos7524_5677 [Nostoc sp. PCC 7524]